MNGTRLVLLLGFLLAASFSVSGCQGETVDPLNSGVATNEPMIEGARKGDEVVRRASGVAESSEGDSSSESDSTPKPTISGTPRSNDDLSPIEQDAQHYAEQFGVDLSEAVTRLTLQVPIGKLGAAIEANEKDTFAGLWIQHEPEYRVVVAFTKDGESTVAKYVQDGPLLELIEVRNAEATLRELERAQLEAGRIVANLGFNLASGIIVQENRAELYATDRTALEDALRESGKTLPDHVVIIGQ